MIGKVLVPQLRKGAIVIMDNPSSHKGPKMRSLIEDAGATPLYLPPYSPDFNPIENAFAKLRRFCAKLLSAQDRAIGTLSADSSISSHRRNPKTTSKPQGMMQPDRIAHLRVSAAAG
jgi:transposase